MAIDFNQLRARKGSNFAALNAKLEATGQSGSFKKDERIWKPQANKDNTSSNIIRFLPISYVDEVAVSEGKLKETDLTPLATIHKHSFQGPKGWYIENSLKTIGQPCPVYAKTGPLWALQKKNNDEILKKSLMKQMPKTSYYANVLIIKDGTNPQNNGKVMIWEFGQKIRDLIETANKPVFDTDTPFDPFDMFTGANLILNLTYTKKKIGERESLVAAFDGPGVKWAANGPLADGDETEMERIWKESHSMAAFYDPKNFKSFDDLTAKYEKVMGEDGAASNTKPKTAEDMLAEMTDGAKEVQSKEPPSKPEPSPGKSVEPEDDDPMAEFEKMMAAME